MTDRELLQAAAKAAGYTIHFGDFMASSSEVEYWVDELCGGKGAYWNPLADDGDALRLAVKLGLTISTRPKRGSRGTIVWTYSVPQQSEPHGEDPFAATRRVIVRAAAAIGKEMP